MELKNRVKELRARYNLSQGDLGKLADASRQTISLIERGN
jgi:putative transcriptional regulator